MAFSGSAMWLVLAYLSLCLDTCLCPAQQPEESPDKAIVLRWIEVLKSKNALERARAAELLGQAGKSALPAVPALCQALDDSVPAVRIVAVRALAQLTGLDPKAESAIVQILDSTDRDLRLVVLDALGAGRKDCVVGEEVLSRLLRLMDDLLTPAGKLALEAVQRCQVRNTKKTAEILVQHLRKKGTPINAVIVRLLGQVPAGRAVTAEALCRALRYPDAPTKTAAQEALLRLISEHQEIADWVRLNTDTEDQAVRAAQLCAIYSNWLTHRDQQSLQTLVKHSRDGDAQVRAAAYTLLALADFAPEEKVKLFMAGLKDGDERVRRTVAQLALSCR